MAGEAGVTGEYRFGCEGWVKAGLALGVSKGQVCNEAYWVGRIGKQGNGLACTG